MIALLLAAAMPAVPMLTPAGVVRDHERLSGRTVRVRGRLGQCWPLSCSLDDVQGPGTLSLGGSRTFDAVAVPQCTQHSGTGHPDCTGGLIGRTIVVEGEVGGCFQHPPGDSHHHPNAIAICTDRADQLRNPRLIEPAPPRDPA